MNVLDIAQNSVRAEATCLEISIMQDTKESLQTLVIKDNGKGMTAEMAEKVVNPFFTTRTTRKVGLGLPFLKMEAEMTGGTLQIKSVLGKGTTVTATFGLTHIDLPPLGDMGSTIATLVQCNPEMEIQYTFIKDTKTFVFTTKEVKEILGDIPLSTPNVAIFIRDYITENTEEL